MAQFGVQSFRDWIPVPVACVGAQLVQCIAVMRSPPSAHASTRLDGSTSGLLSQSHSTKGFPLASTGAALAALLTGVTPAVDDVAEAEAGAAADELATGALLAGAAV